jgi:hypothetical protein
VGSVFKLGSMLQTAVLALLGWFVICWSALAAVFRVGVVSSVWLQLMAGGCCWGAAAAQPLQQLL